MSSRVIINMDKNEFKFDEKTFVPKGAIAFFLLVLLVMSSIWLFVYFLMIKQA